MRRLFILTFFVFAFSSRRFQTNANLQSLKAANEQEHVCQDNECHHLAASLIEVMNESVDPCEDFRGYTCGNKMKKSSNPDIRQEIIGILKSPVDHANLKPLNIERQLYQTCMESGKHLFDNKNHFLTTLQSTDGLSAISTHSVQGFRKSWQEADIHYAKLGFQFTFFDLRITPDIKNPENNMITISPPLYRPDALASVQALYSVNFSQEYSSALEEVIRSGTRFISANIQQRKRTTFDNIAPFASKFQSIISLGDDKKKLLNKMSIHEWQSLYMKDVHNTKGQINWLETLRSLFEPVHINIQDSELIYVEGRQYFKDLGTLLQHAAKEVIISYVHLHFMSQVYKFIDTTATSNLVRTTECLESSDLVGAYHVYVQKHNFQQSQALGNRISDDIKRFILSKSLDKWTNATSKDYIVHAINSSKLILGYPEWMHDRSYIDHYYHDIDVDTKYFRNMMNLKHFQRRRDLARFRNRKIHRHFQTSAIFNGIQQYKIIGYESGTPEIVYSIDYLKESTYALLNAKLPLSIIYGGFGYDVAHLWLNLPHQSGARLVASNHDCILRQIHSENRNIERSDPYTALVQFTSLDVALKMFNNALVDEKKTTKLPRLEKLTTNQLFFLSFAYSKCIDHGPKTPLNLYVSNFEEFSTAYRCPVQSKMNRRNKCFPSILE